jgi:hypothetical protein
MSLLRSGGNSLWSLTAPRRGFFLVVPSLARQPLLSQHSTPALSSSRMIVAAFTTAPASRATPAATANRWVAVTLQRGHPYSCRGLHDCLRSSSSSRGAGTAAAKHTTGSSTNLYQVCRVLSSSSSNTTSKKNEGGGDNDDETTKDIVLTPGEKVVAVSRLTLWAGVAAFALACGYFIVKELIPT